MWMGAAEDGRRDAAGDVAAEAVAGEAELGASSATGAGMGRSRGEGGGRVYMRGETTGEATTVGSRTGRFLAATLAARSCSRRMRAKSVAEDCTRSLCFSSERVGRAVRRAARGERRESMAPLLLLLLPLLLLLNWTA